MFITSFLQQRRVAMTIVTVLGTRVAEILLAVVAPHCGQLDSPVSEASLTDTFDGLKSLINDVLNNEVNRKCSDRRSERLTTYWTRHLQNKTFFILTNTDATVDRRL